MVGGISLIWAIPIENSSVLTDVRWYPKTRQLAKRESNSKNNRQLTNVKEQDMKQTRNKHLCLLGGITQWGDCTIRWGHAGDYNPWEGNPADGWSFSPAGPQTFT